MPGARDSRSEVTIHAGHKRTGQVCQLTPAEPWWRRLLHIERRRSDFIENIHDGSILDYYFDTTGEYIKLVYTTIIGLALLTFTITGFWLWYGPKRMRRSKRLGSGGKNSLPALHKRRA